MKNNHNYVHYLTVLTSQFGLKSRGDGTSQGTSYCVGQTQEHNIVKEASCCVGKAEIQSRFY